MALVNGKSDSPSLDVMARFVHIACFAMRAAPYSHSQQPHAVASRPKYRDPAEVENSTLASNLMYDKRVVRGNTYAAQILPATAQAEQLEMERKSRMQ